MDTRSHEAVVTDQFGPRAEAYLTSAVHAGGEDLADLKRIIGQRPDAIALDLGCGGGHGAYAIAPLVRGVVAYDLSAAMIATVAAEARRRGLTNLETRQGVAEHLPWPDDTFDIVISRFSAHHWRDIAAGLGEARRVLKPGGLAVFMDVVAPPSPLIDTWLQTLELLRDVSHVRDYSLSEWRSLLSAAGLTPADVLTYRLSIEFASWIERIRTPEVQVRAIHALRGVAADAVVRHLELKADGSFTLDTALITARG
jgi:SAM-dependent methyltransferase